MRMGTSIRLDNNLYIIIEDLWLLVSVMLCTLLHIPTTLGESSLVTCNNLSLFVIWQQWNVCMWFVCGLKLWQTRNLVEQNKNTDCWATFLMYLVNIVLHSCAASVKYTFIHTCAKIFNDLYNIVESHDEIEFFSQLEKRRMSKKITTNSKRSKRSVSRQLIHSPVP